MGQTTKEIYITIFLQSFIWKLKCASMLWFILGIFKLLIPRVELIELTFSSIRLMLFFNFCICHLHHLHCLGEAKLLKDNSTKTTISVRRGNIICYSIVFSSNWTLPYCWSMYASCHIYSIIEVRQVCFCHFESTDPLKGCVVASFYFNLSVPSLLWRNKINAKWDNLNKQALQRFLWVAQINRYL